MMTNAAKLARAMALVLPVTAFAGYSALAQSVLDVVGTWTLVSSVIEKDGAKTDQYGAGARGMMSLDTDEYFMLTIIMLTIIGPDLPRFASGNRATGTPEENKAVVGKSIAMIGTYSVNPADRTLTFKVERATFPNWDGTEQKRSIVSVSSDGLKYTSASASVGGPATTTWKRAK